MVAGDGLSHPRCSRAWSKSMRQVGEIKAAYDWMIASYQRDFLHALASNDRQGQERLDQYRDHLERAVFVLLFAQYVFPNAARSAAFARASQPLPVARRASTTSGSSKSATLRPFGGKTPRAGRTTLSPSRISARAKNVFVSLGASSRSVHALAPEAGFVFMAMPHRGDPTVGRRRRPDRCAGGAASNAYLRLFPRPPAPPPLGRASPPPQLCGPMSASVGFRARLAGIFAARPKGRSPA